MKMLHSGFNPTYSEDAPAHEEVRTSSDDSILEFGAPWCGHCIAAEPTVREAFTEHPSLPHIKVHDGKGKRLGRAFKVKLWPTLIKLHDGVEVARLVRPTCTNEVQQLLTR